LKKDIQHNGQKKKGQNDLQNITQKNQRLSNTNPTKIQGLNSAAPEYK